MDIVKPPALHRGDAIGVIVPASAVHRKRIERALERLRQRGFRIKTYGDLYRKNGYLAGDDALRAGELNTAFADPQTTCVWCARGGYGMVRLLDRIDFDAIRRRPKVFIGFSDITILHLAIQQRTGLVTFHGPNLQDGFGKDEDMPPANEAALWRAVLADEQDASQQGYEFRFLEAEQLELRSIAGGVASGPLTGGNLAVLAGLMGTPYEIDTTGRILFLEDVGERAYRIDRYLAQLSLAGKLQAAAGILLGSFSFEKDERADSQQEIFAVLEHYLAPLHIPLLAGFPAGHTDRNLTLPFGTPIQLDATQRRITVLENPVLM